MFWQAQELRLRVAQARLPARRRRRLLVVVAVLVLAQARRQQQGLLEPPQRLLAVGQQRVFDVERRRQQQPQVLGEPQPTQQKQQPRKRLSKVVSSLPALVANFVFRCVCVCVSPTFLGYVQPLLPLFKKLFTYCVFFSFIRVWSR